MAEGQLLFTLDYEQFMENWGQNIFPYLQEEFDRSKISLSRSLLLSTETENSYWLVDFENEKTYNIKKENDITIDILEGTDIGERFDILSDIGTILPRLKNGMGTRAGIIDALSRIKFDKFNIEHLKRLDLTPKKLNFEPVYFELQDAFGTLVDILNSSRKSLIGLSYNDVEQIKSYVIQFYDMTLEIGNFEVESENVREDHAELSRSISEFRETVKKSLLQASAY